MPLRSTWSPAREGFTQDTFNNLIKHTVLNPALTIPLLAALHLTPQGLSLSKQHALPLKVLRGLAAFGLLDRVSAWLSERVINNWSSDVYDWEKEVVVVTGGSDGIGKEVVLFLAEKGVRVAVLDVQELTYEAPPTVSFYHCDLASPPSIASATTSIKSSLGPPTVLINNAGIARGKSILASTEADINLTFRVNTFAHYFLAQQFLPSMVEQNHGMVVTVASLAGYLPAPNMVDYAASKAAAIAFHEGLASELATLYKAPKVRTVLMCQGYTRTALFKGFGTPSLHVETVAEEIVRAVLGGRSRHLLLPENMWLSVAKMRGWPLWMQYGARKGLDRLMRGFRGRQVVQPSEVRGGEKK